MKAYLRYSPIVALVAWSFCWGANAACGNSWLSVVCGCLASIFAIECGIAIRRREAARA